MDENVSIGRYRLEIWQDEDAQSPRDWDNVGKMICWHSRYNLGDEHSWGSPRDAWEDLSRLDVDRDLDDEFDINEVEDADLVAAAEKRIVWLPLYLYDHSGITMSTGPFGCRWDSGQVGFIYAEKGFEEMTDEQLISCMEGEVRVYDQYLKGEVYGYKVFETLTKVINTCECCGQHLPEPKKIDSYEEGIGSCWGYYGNEHKKSGLLDAAMEEMNLTPEEVVELKEKVRW